MAKYCYLFEKINPTDKNGFGGKGANLAGMVKVGLPVPAGFVISTAACVNFYENNKNLATGLMDEVKKRIIDLEKKTGKGFGRAENPLLVSVRSGARVSMPGMMNTILNLGLNDEIVNQWSKVVGRRFVLDNYRRFIQMYSDVVKGIDSKEFEEILADVKAKQKAKTDADLNVESLEEIIKRYKNIYKKAFKEEFPQDIYVLLENAIRAVFLSWDTERAKVYRQLNDIPSSWGTAVNIQQMVFGNINDNSGSGVAFSRNPSTGDHKILGEFLVNAQGEDVVAGVRTPMEMEKMQQILPEVYAQLVDTINKLEKHYKDMQDVEFTVENGKLYMLQTRVGKRTINAALKMALDMLDEKLIDEKEAVLRIDTKQISQLLHPTFDEEVLKKSKIMGKGLPASPGSASGIVVFDPKRAEELNAKGKKVILVRQETSPEDIVGMQVSQGILTARGGMTSHAAVVARTLGKCCVSGCGELIVYESKHYAILGDKKLIEGDEISLNGNTGDIYTKIIPTVEAKITGNFERFMEIARKYQKMKVYANADTKADATLARGFGAEGIGLVRTEHMFFQEERIMAVREMIIAENEKARAIALKKLLPIQQADFVEIFKVMKGLPVTVRLLDPPLHEFLPRTKEDVKKLSEFSKVDVAKIQRVVEELHEFNPMMGHRGCRLSVTFPDITVMQVTAIINAAIKSQKANKTPVNVDIMIPLVTSVKEFLYVKNIVKQTADAILEKSDEKVLYRIGTMIETPRAAMVAGELAKVCDFFSFGTNDLTQLTFGFSRDDAAKFLPGYYENKIMDFDPFVKVDDVVADIVKSTVAAARNVNKTFKIGVCGEQGADRASIDSFLNSGVTYVSVSPFRVASSIVASAQSSIRNSKK